MSGNQNLRVQGSLSSSGTAAARHLYAAQHKHGDALPTYPVFSFVVFQLDKGGVVVRLDEVACSAGTSEFKHWEGRRPPTHRPASGPVARCATTVRGGRGHDGGFRASHANIRTQTAAPCEWAGVARDTDRLCTVPSGR